MRVIAKLPGGYELVGDSCGSGPWFRRIGGGIESSGSVATARIAPVLVTELVRVEGRARKARDEFTARMCLEARNGISQVLKRNEYEKRGLRCP